MSRLEEILQIVSANSEEAIDDMLTLLTPDSTPKEDIQETFEEVLGYDPTTYFDEKGIEKQVDKIMDRDIPDEVTEYLETNRREVVTSSMETFEENKPKYYEDAISSTILDKTDININELDSDDEDDFDDDVSEDFDDFD